MVQFEAVPLKKQKNITQGKNFLKFLYKDECPFYYVLQLIVF